MTPSSEANFNQKLITAILEDLSDQSLSDSGYQVEIIDRALSQLPPAADGYKDLPKRTIFVAVATPADLATRPPDELFPPLVQLEAIARRVYVPGRRLSWYAWVCDGVIWPR